MPVEQKTFIIIPAYNEEQHIPDVIRKAKKFGEVVVVDDGSKDSTSKISKSSGAKVLQHVINMGKGAALKTGCDYALKNGAEIIIAIDADAQHDPEDIPRFIESLKNADIVFGYREFSREMPSILRFGNRMISKITKLLYGIRLHDTQCGFRAFTPESYKKIRWISSNYSMESEMIANMGIKKLKFIEIPIKTVYKDRYKGTTIFDGIKIVLNLLWWRLAK